MGWRQLGNPRNKQDLSPILLRMKFGQISKPRSQKQILEICGQRPQEEQRAECGARNLFESPGQVQGGLRGSNTAQSEEGSASAKGPECKSSSTLSTICFKGKEWGLERLYNLQVTGVSEEAWLLTRTCSVRLMGHVFLKLIKAFCFYLKNSNHGNINIKPEVLGDGVIVNCFFRGAWRIEFVSLLMLQGCCLFFRSLGGAH